MLYLDCLECEEKYCKKYNIMSNKIVIGIDQSYKDTGISISMNGKIKTISHCYLANLKSNSEKRLMLKERLDIIFRKCKSLSIKYNAQLICVIERIRLQSQGFINIDYIKSIGALNAMIVDKANEYNIKVYSVDTRCWKSNVIGTSKEKKNKYGIDPKKYPTILWLISKGYESYLLQPVSNKTKKGIVKQINNIKYTYNDNSADSACISLFPFMCNDNNLLKEEH